MMQAQWAFRIPAPLKGWTATNGRQWTKRFRQYAKWREYVRILANQAGVPDTLERQWQVSLHIRIYWRLKARIDTTDVLKGVEDALWKQDRAVTSVFVSRTEHTGEEEWAEVTVGIDRCELDGSRGR